MWKKYSAPRKIVQMATESPKLQNSLSRCARKPAWGTEAGPLGVFPRWNLV